ncbi:hypothetical protein [Longitalea arenae]|uniref:hypothetical protein n=1 Tax=Longitalea arenae TaxID=2812558 RepID=UPI0019686695|nr:hypothetical protein [Longitalea arenae]
MQRNDLYLLGTLWLCALFIFLPLFYSDYLFMDEVWQLWGYRSIPGFYMFIDEGRWLTEVLQRWLFNMIDTIHGVIYMRLFSLFGWLLCLPIWYLIFKREVANVSSYQYLPFFTCLYLITSLPFIVAVQWATCLQFFIADTACLLAGALVLQSIRSGDAKLRMAFRAFIVPLLLGIPALFLYQGSWACFLLPLLLYFINPMNYKKDRVLMIGSQVYFLVNAVYYIAYKVSFRFFENIVPDPRNALHFDLFEKMKYFLARPLERSFRFTLLTHEESALSKKLYAVMLLALVILAFVRFGKAKWLQAIKYLGVIGAFFVFSYLPSLLIEERFPSNRTLMALNMCVFIVWLEMALYFIKNRRLLLVVGVAGSLFCIFCARYNFQEAFLRPQVDELAAIKTHIQQHYHKGIQSFHFIRPSDQFVAEKYKVHKSMDEFGVASSSFAWVPESLVKQLVYEQTGNRQQAAQLVVKHWASKEEYIRSGETLNSNTLLIDVPALMNSIKP